MTYNVSMGTLNPTIPYYTICDVPASMLATILASREVRQAAYKAVQECTTDAPRTAVKKSSRIQCATACDRLDCEEYNFDDTTKDCSRCIRALAYSDEKDILYQMERCYAFLWKSTKWFF